MGVDWPYPDLAADECVLTQDMQDKFGYQVGQTVTFTYNYKLIWVATATIYNDFIKSETDPLVNYESFSENDYSEIQCKIAGFISAGKGKFPSDKFTL